MKNRGYISATGLLLSLIVAAGAGFNGQYRPWEQAWSSFGQITLVERQESPTVLSEGAVQLESLFHSIVSGSAAALFIHDTALINHCIAGLYSKQIRIALRLAPTGIKKGQQLRCYFSRSQCSSKDDPYSFSV